ncbi:MAG: hypothetical protein AAF206_21925, partial [Bacteroidota bacterium]
MNPLNLNRMILIFGIMLIHLSTSAQLWQFSERFLANDTKQEPSDQFGGAIDFTDDHMMIAAPFHSHGDTSQSRIFNAGAVYVYQKQGDGSWLQSQKLVAQSRYGTAFFGFQLAMDG